MMAERINELIKDEVVNQPSIWKLYLYQLQKDAPKPSAVFCREKVEKVPTQYGLEFHGKLHHRKCQELLPKEGSYLVRKSEASDEHHTLSIRFSGVVKHYKLYFDGQYFVGEKKFDKLEDLITDGLVTLYLECKASKVLHQLSSVNYRQSPYFTLNRSVWKTLNKTKNGRMKSSFMPTTSKRNNLSPTAKDMAEGKLLNTPKIAIPNELLNIKLEHEDVAASNFEPETTLNHQNEDDVKNQSSTESLDKSDSEEITYDRPHRFNNHTFTGLHWCGFCGNFLWGLMLQGVKCHDCGFKAHRPCSLKVPSDCCPDLKNLQCIFGMDLSTSLQSSPSKENIASLNVPSIVSECITEIEARGLTAEGIYRVPGSHEQIDSLRLSFERDGNNVSLDEKSVPDVNVVAGLLKLYFRLLPLRLITIDCFKRLTEANKIGIPDGRVASVQEALKMLPLPHYETLKVVIFHLARVCDHSAINKMTATSLSTIFGPTLIHVDADDELMQPEDLLALKLSAQEPRVIEMLIVLHKDVFS